MSEAERQIETQEEEFRAYAREILEFLPLKSGRLLDVGCGIGWVVAEAKARGFEALGIDPKASYINAGKKYLGVDLRVATLERFLPKEKFDVVVLKHVLEHIKKPDDFLQKASKVLRPGGYLLVACPNIASLMARIFADRWYGLCPSEHVWQFTPKTLAALLERNGFKIDKVVINNLDYRPAGIKRLVFSFLVGLANTFRVGDQVVIICHRR